MTALLTILYALAAQLTPDQRQDVAQGAAARLRQIRLFEARNALAIMGVDGYQRFPIMSTDEQLALLREHSPVVADEFERRMKRAHVLPVEAVQEAWPEVKGAIIADGEKANLRAIRARMRGGL